MSPSVPGTPCPEAGCPEITPAGESCCEHDAGVWNDTRPSASDRGYGARHRRWRRKVLRRDPLCVLCLERDRVVPSKVADHIVPWQDGGAKYDVENGQGLCQTCHNRKTKRERA